MDAFDISGITVEERYEWLLDNPESARHLLGLLAQGKGDRDAFTKMVARIMVSERGAKAKRRL